MTMSVIFRHGTLKYKVAGIRSSKVPLFCGTRTMILMKTRCDDVKPTPTGIGEASRWGRETIRTDLFDIRSDKSRVLTVEGNYCSSSSCPSGCLGLLFAT